MNKIAIICPYFGKFPSNIKLTINSMKKNEKIDWLFFTDSDEIRTYENIIVYKMSFDEMKIKIAEKIGTTLYSPYKLCDYKPTYGYLFEEYLKKYSFWGYCDVDAIYGDILSFITPNILDNYDKIYELGHLSIYKNNQEVNNLFFDIEKYDHSLKEIFDNKNIYVFDETLKSKNHISINELLIRAGKKIYSSPKDYADIEMNHRNFYLVNDNIAKWNYFEYNNGILKYYTKKDGYIRDISYLHLQQKKDLKINVEKDSLNNYVITPKGFFSKREVYDNDFYHFYDFRLFFFFSFIIKRKYKKIKNDINFIFDK